MALAQVEQGLFYRLMSKVFTIEVAQENLKIGDKIEGSRIPRKDKITWQRPTVTF